jgi:hypothetical protein
MKKNPSPPPSQIKIKIKIFELWNMLEMTESNENK